MIRYRKMHTPKYLHYDTNIRIIGLIISCFVLTKERKSASGWMDDDFPPTILETILFVF